MIGTSHPSNGMKDLDCSTKLATTMFKIIAKYLCAKLAKGKKIMGIIIIVLILHFDMVRPHRPNDLVNAAKGYLFPTLVEDALDLDQV